MRLRPAMPAEQIRKARMPDQVGTPRQRNRLGVGWRHHDKAAEPELGKYRRSGMNLRPDQAVAVDREPGLGRRIEAHDVEVAACRPLGAVWHMHAVPDRRMGLLQRLKLHRNIIDREMLAAIIKHLAGQPLHHERDRFGVDLLCLSGIRPIVLKLNRYRAPAEPDLQPSTAHLVEHADFFDQPQRMMQRHRPHQRAEAQSARTLRYGRQENARRRRHAERRRVMLGEMIGVEAGAVVSLGDAQAILVEVGERSAVAVEMIKNAEFHAYSPERPQRDN